MIQIYSEAFTRRCSVKKLLLEILQNSQETSCARVLFVTNLQASGLQLDRQIFKRFVTPNQILGWFIIIGYTLQNVLQNHTFRQPNFLQGSPPSWSLYGLCYSDSPIILQLVQKLTSMIEKKNSPGIVLPYLHTSIKPGSLQ